MLGGRERAVDEALRGRALLNLVDNAIKFAREGGLVSSTLLDLFVIPGLYLRFGAQSVPLRDDA